MIKLSEILFFAKKLYYKITIFRTKYINTEKTVNYMI